MAMQRNASWRRNSSVRVVLGVRESIVGFGQNSNVSTISRVGMFFRFAALSINAVCCSGVVFPKNSKVICRLAAGIGLPWLDSCLQMSAQADRLFGSGQRAKNSRFNGCSLWSVPSYLEFSPQCVGCARVLQSCTCGSPNRGRHDLGEVRVVESGLAVSATGRAKVSA